ncbi:MAG: flavin reductase [Methylocella sp.]
MAWGARGWRIGEDMAKPKNGRMEIRAMPGQGLDPAQFRDAMSRVAAAVHIITTDGPAGLAGITATSVASITDEPPMMLFCINKTSPSAGRMISNGAFCINTLAASHAALADIFAGRTGHRLGERFAGGEWTKLATGAPVLRSAAAAFDCRLVEAKSVLTHFVMIGAVEAADFSPEGGNLSYAYRKYGTV